STLGKKRRSLVNLSVIVPTFNRAALLERCLRSLIAAGVTNMEIIVVDDGSTDSTATVVALYPGIEYIPKANAGPAATRNLGSGASRGRYVAFIDSDDEWIEGGAGRLVAQLDANPDLPVIFADAAMGDHSTGFVSFVQTYGKAEFSQLPHEERAGVCVF